MTDLDVEHKPDVLDAWLAHVQKHVFKSRHGLRRLRNGTQSLDEIPVALDDFLVDAVAPLQGSVLATSSAVTMERLLVART